MKIINIMNKITLIIINTQTNKYIKKQSRLGRNCITNYEFKHVILYDWLIRVWSSRLFMFAYEFEFFVDSESNQVSRTISNCR